MYNLSMLVQLALMGRHAGVDLWIHRTPGGSGIAEAIDYVAATLLQPGGWPFQQLNPMNYGLLIQLLLAADKAEVSNARQPVIERIADLGDLSKAPRIDGLIQPGAR